MENISLSAQASTWIEYKRHLVKPSTAYLYESHLRNHILPYFCDIAELNEDDVQSWVLQLLGKDLSTKTVRDALVVLKMLMKHLAKKNIISLQPWDIKFPSSEQPSRVEVLGLHEQRKLAKYLKENFSLKNLGLLLTLSTGMRIGETCALRWKDIDAAEGTVRVAGTTCRDYNSSSGRSITTGGPKTHSSERIIPLPAGVRSTVKPFCRVFNPEYYVCTGAGTPMDPRVLRKHFYKISTQLELTGIHFHGLRHTFATRCIESGCDVKTVSALLGHANVSTTMDLYVHPDITQKRKAIEKAMKRLDP